MRDEYHGSLDFVYCRYRHLHSSPFEMVSKMRLLPSMKDATNILVMPANGSGAFGKENKKLAVLAQFIKEINAIWGGQIRVKSDSFHFLCLLKTFLKSAPGFRTKNKTDNESTPNRPP